MDPKALHTNNENLSNNKIDTNAEGNINKNESVYHHGDDAQDDHELYNDEESSEEYGSSGEKYGWYNGFSDDAIDDTFDGDPEATWNVD